MEEIIARRVFDPLYIYLDIVFLLVLLGLLLYRRKYTAVLVGISAGVLYMLVDYGIFHLLCHSRYIEGGNLFWVLLWMSMSYGFTNFVWIWLWVGRDRCLKEIASFILLWWFCAPLIVSVFSSGENLIMIQRTTSEYHGYMAIIMFVGYAGAIIYNMGRRHDNEKIPILRLLLIGVTVQFSWEFTLLLGGIRSAGIISYADKIRTLAVNSLLETNLGMPYIFLIYAAITGRFRSDLKRRINPVGVKKRICEMHSLNSGYHPGRKRKKSRNVKAHS